MPSTAPATEAPPLPAPAGWAEMLMKVASGLQTEPFSAHAGQSGFTDKGGSCVLPCDVAR